jgi:ABC-type antimicrobial peptide transport system ATPase subunit
MLTSDRILLGDSVRDVLRADARAEPLGPRGRTRLADLVIEHRIASVTDALNAASSWVRSKFLDRTYGSSESSSTLYLDVARRIAKSTYRTKTGLSAAQEAKTIASLEQSIRDIQRRAAEYQEFGLGPLALSPELLPTIQGTKGNRLHLIQTILEPHLASVKARYDSIQPVYQIVSTFVAALNAFLKDKKVAYSVRTGFRIVSDGSEGPPTEISPGQLSSGEQQLLLLFCHILTTRDSPSIFFIDEPELSLNIVWQRRLVSSMLEVAKGSSLQLILASHSMEILAKHRDRVVGMRETKVG